MSIHSIARNVSSTAITAGAFVPLNFMAVRLAESFIHPRTFATANGVARSATNYIALSGAGTITSLGFTTSAGAALPAIAGVVSAQSGRFLDAEEMQRIYDTVAAANAAARARV